MACISLGRVIGPDVWTCLILHSYLGFGGRRMPQRQHAVALQVSAIARNPDDSPMPATMAEKRILGSGGVFGYWGWFREDSIGRYMAYYGKASDCFIVRLKDGKNYMLSCIDPLGMMEYIDSKLNAR